MIYNNLNLINPNISIKQALNIQKSTGEKCLVVVNQKNKLLGTLSDGDIRNAILKNVSLGSSIRKFYERDCIYFTEGNYDLKKIKKIFINDIIGIIPIVDKDLIVIKTINWHQVFKNTKHKSKEKINIPLVIMSGGKGTRLHPLTNILPKPLIPINEKTVIEHIIERFLKYGINLIYLNINYKALIIKAFFSELKKNYKIKFIEEKKPLGTAGSLSLLSRKINSTFFVSNCDSIINTNFYDVYNFHLKNKNDFTMVVSAKQFAIPYGTCVLNKNGLLKKIVEKPNYDLLINSGLYILEPKIFKLIPKDHKLDFNELINTCINQKMKIGLYPINDNLWIDVGQWSEYKKSFERL